MPTDLRNEVKTLLINSYEDSNGYFSQIEKALKRNEPMKRIKHKIKDRAYPELLCPICFLQNHPLNHYCPYCGQRLDWGSEK